MPVIEDNKLAQLSTSDILLKLFVFAAVPINPNSGLQHYCSGCCTSTAKNRLPALKERKKEEKRKHSSIWRSTGDSEMILESITDSSLNIRAAIVFLQASWQR